MWSWLKIAVASVVLLGLAQTNARAIVIRADRDDSQYVALGSKYDSVGRFDGTMGSSGFIASGTLIAPDWVLTAAHVVDHATSLNFSVGGKTYTADSWVANPSWTGDLWAGYDIGLVHLQTPVAGVAPALRYTGNAELTKVGTAVGYGRTGTGITGGTTLDGQKRGAQNVVDQVQKGRLMVSDFDSAGKRPSGTAMGSTKPQVLEGLIAPGDSGGGVFLDTATGSYLMGVNSFVGANDGGLDSSYGDISGHTRVSAFNSWIDRVMADGLPKMAPAVEVPLPNGAVALPDGPGPGQAPGPVPEPSTWALLVAAALAGCALRRRFRL